MRKPESYASVWDAIADTPGQAANLRARTELMRQIAAVVNKQGSSASEPSDGRTGCKRSSALHQELPPVRQLPRQGVPNILELRILVLILRFVVIHAQIV